MLAATWRSFSEDARRFLSGAVLLELGHAFLWALQNLYVRSVGYGEADVGLVLGASGLGVVASTIPSAWAYERLGARSSLGLAAIGFSLAVAGLAASTSLAPLMAFSFLQGAAFTLHRVVSAPFLVSAARPEERTRLFGAEFATHTAAATLGLAAAGLLAYALEGALSETVALRAALLLGALVSLSSALCYRGIGPVRPPTADARGPAHEERRAARRRRVVRGAGVRRMFRVLAPRRWHLWWRLALPHGLVGLGAGLTIPFINLYFTDRFGLPKGELGLVMGAAQLTMTVAVLGVPRLVRRTGLLQATILTELLSLPFFLMLAFTTNMAVAIGAFVMRTALMNLSHPLWRNLIMEITPVRWRAAINGVTMLAWNLGWAASNRVGGTLIERSPDWLGEGVDGYALPMVATSTAYVLAILLEARFFWHVRALGRAPSDGAPAPPVLARPVAPVLAASAAAPAASAAPAGLPAGADVSGLGTAPASPAPDSAPTPG